MASLIHQLSWIPARLATQALSFKKVVFVGSISEDDEALLRYQGQLHGEGYDSETASSLSALKTALDADTIVVHLTQITKAKNTVFTDSVASCMSLIATAQTLHRRSQDGEPGSPWLFSLVDSGSEIDGLAKSALHGLARVLKMEIPLVFGGLFETENGSFPTAALQYAQGFDYVKVTGDLSQTAILLPIPQVGPAAESKQVVREIGSYLITGGTKGMGLEIATWLGEQGASDIILVSRGELVSAHRGTPDASKQQELVSRVKKLQELGVNVHQIEADMSRPEIGKILEDSIARLNVPKVRGVVHAAGVAEYHTLDKCPATEFAAVLAPKIAGALALHDMYPPGSLDFFILTSSFGQLVGFPGQLSYASANSFLDGFATYRRRQGDNCTSIQWSSWRGVGLMAQNQSATRMILKGMTARGFGDIEKAEGLEALESIITRLNADQVAVVRALPAQTGERVIHPIMQRLVSPKVELNREDSASQIGYPDHAVAIVGMSCRTAAGSSAEDLWDVISNGKSMEQELDESRFPDIRSHSGKMWGNFIKDVASFDHSFFKKTKREAAALDPHQRLLLETTYHALESAGEFGKLQERPSETHDASESGEVTGCFIGMNAPDYPLNLACNPPSPYTGFGMLRSFVAGRLSHHFGWTGPSHTIDTACSSAMVAVHQACRAIQLGECNRAIAGGVNLITNTALFHALRTGGFLNDEGPCKTFDADARGYCRGEAVGVIVLKPLRKAMQDGDDIKGVLLSTGNNQNINSTSITNPVLESQAALYRDVLRRALVEPGDVSYVEAHGTGTRAGDPVEVQGIRQILGGKQRRAVLHVGGVKPNVGHSEGASGIISLIKVLLMMKHGKITPQANFRTLNPNIPPLEPDMMAISTSLKQWDDDKRIALVNSYGASGNNAAAVVAPPPPSSTRPTRSEPSALSKWPVLVTASTKTSLLAYLSKLQAWIEKHSSTSLCGADIAYTLATRQARQYAQSFTTSATSLQDIGAQLAKPDRALTSNAQRKRAVLLFSGQNGDTVPPAQALYDASVLFRNHLHKCDEALRSLALPSIFPFVLRGVQSDSGLLLRHAAMFAIQYASGMAWIDSGMEPGAVCGHSFGEWAALTVSGVLTLEAGIKLVTGYVLRWVTLGISLCIHFATRGIADTQIGRARIIEESWGEDTGAMIAIEDELTITNTTPAMFLEAFRTHHTGAELEIACYNGPNNFVVAGRTADIDLLERYLENIKNSNRSLRFKVLRGMHAYHSVLADSIVEESGHLSNSVSFQEPRFHFESCHKDPWTGIESNIIAKNTRGAVYFSEAMSRIVRRLGPSIFVEAGLGGPIIAMARNALSSPPSDHEFIAISSRDPVSSLAEATTSLWAFGQRTIQFWPFHDAQREQFRTLDLPPYHFDKADHWLDYIAKHGGDVSKSSEIPSSQVTGSCVSCSNAPDSSYIAMEKSHPQQTGQTVFRINVGSRRYQDLVAGHSVVGSPICPAAMYLELAALGVSMLPEVERMFNVPELGVEMLEIKAPLGLDVSRTVRLRLTKKSDSSWEFALYSTKNTDAPLTHANGVICLHVSGPKGTRSDSADLWARINDLREDPDSEALRGTMVYKVFSSMANYSDPYQGLRHLFGRGSEAAGDISMPMSALASVTRSPNDELADPVILDNFLQVPGAFVHSLRNSVEGANDGSMAYICTGMASVRPMNRFKGSGRYRAYAKIVSADNNSVILDVDALDNESRNVVWTCKGLRFFRIPRTSLAKALAAANPGMDIKPSPITREAPFATSTSSSKAELVGTSPSKPEAQSNVESDPFPGVRAVLSKSLDIPEDVVSRESTLDALGVDSLVASEVLAGLRQKFAIEVSISNLTSLEDVQSLCNLLQPHSNALHTKSHDITSTTAETNPSIGQSLSMIIDVLSKSLHVPAAEIQANSKLEDLGVDSLVAVEIAASLSKLKGCQVSPDQLLNSVDVTSLASLFGDTSASASRADSVVSTSSTSSSNAASGASTPSTGATTPSGIEKQMTVEMSTGAMQSAFQSVRRNFDFHAKKTNLSGYWDSVYPEQLVVVSAFIVEAFEQLGCRVQDYKLGEKLPELPQTLQKYDREVPRLWDILEEAGIVERTQIGFVRGPTVLPDYLHHKSAQALSDALMSNFPAFRSTHGLPALLGPHLAQSLVGKADPVSLLFGSKDGREYLSDFYANGPDLRACTNVLCDFFNAAIEARSEDGQPFRVLEIGAGTGGTTKHLIPLLQAANVPFEYTFTELSGSLLARAKNVLFKDVPNMDFRKLDIEKEPPTELCGRYHVVVSSNCIHATRNLNVSLVNIRKLLRPRDGCVALVELTQKLAWYDLVWGLLDGWWLFEDGRRYALQSPWNWERVMLGAGFSHVDWSESTSRESRSVRVICGMVAEPEEGTFPKATSFVIHSGQSPSPSRKAFLIPDGFGQGAVFRSLAPSLSKLKDTCVYALNSPFLKAKYDSESPPTVEELAGIYVAEIKRRQPQGPYVLGGYSFGGVVAYEAARQILEDGDFVEKLLLIDTACPTFATSMPKALVGFLDSIDLFAQPGGQTKQELIRIDCDHFGLARQQLASYRTSKLPGRFMPRTVLFSARLGADKQTTIPPPVVQPSEQAVVDWFLNDRDEHEQAREWMKLLPDVSVVPIDGNHFTTMQPRVATTWASQLADCF